MHESVKKTIMELDDAIREKEADLRHAMSHMMLAEYPGSAEKWASLMASDAKDVAILKAQRKEILKQTKVRLLPWVL